MVTYIIKTQQMKKIILICFAIVAIASCKKVEKENIVTEEIIKDTIILDVSDKPIEKSVKQIKEELAKLLEIDHRNHVLVEYDILESKLGGIGASQKTAQLIVKEIL